MKIIEYLVLVNFPHKSERAGYNLHAKKLFFFRMNLKDIINWLRTINLIKR